MNDGSSTPAAGGGYHHLQTSRAHDGSAPSTNAKREMKHAASNVSAGSTGGGAGGGGAIPLTATAPVTGGSSVDGNSANADYRIVPLPQRVASQPPGDAEPFCSNVVITSKYTAWNFLPLFLVESFRKLANAYFLLVSVLQMVPNITNTGGLPSNLPVLMFILAVDGVLAIIEDRRRHTADNEANSAQCHVVTASYTGTSTNIKPTSDPDVAVLQWADLTVGTIVKLRNRETAPADLLILAVDEVDPSDPNGICYVETKSLDGETNLKLRQACDNTLHAYSAAQVLALAGFLRCENPNKVIGRFDGTLTLSAQSARAPKHPHTLPSSTSSSGFGDATVQMPVSIKNVLLRGCQLRNTDWIYGLVINTGPDTKIMQSSVAARPKWSSINETVNKMIIWLFCFLCALCAAAATAHVVWMARNETDTIYLGANRGAAAQWFISFGSYFLLMYQMIPVSLYVTISMVMFIQAIFMTWDIDMYYGELDVRMIVRSMGLNEELGQISYVFSDKTGTLTCNVMEFRKCSINGVAYGTGTTEIGRAALRRKGVVVPDEPSPSANASGGASAKVPYVNFDDARLFKALERDTANAEADFFLHLSLCQTVIPEVVDGSNEVRFSASSPDEQALVSGAKFFGFSFESRGLGLARIRVHNKALMHNKSAASELQEFKILDVLEFTSERKRMSVVAQYPDGSYWVLTKGADNMIYPLLSKSANSSDVLKATMQHLETFGDDGLRTLTIARRRIDPQVYAAWSSQFKAANSSLEEIEKRKTGLPNRIDDLMCEIETDLELLGATAIEDKLQTHVPRAIANLMTAGMKVWMLTGDKQETAINISYACQLMDNDMVQIVLNCELFPTTDAILARLVAATNVSDGSGSAATRQAVVIDGECLELTLQDDACRAAFLALAMRCDGVVCCRVSPSQKAEVVTLVRAANPAARTLAIGDGANDVAMIQRAHVGVGICGMEGMQAVNSSDYAIGQFYFLEKLLLHHGRLNYKRMAVLVGYMFYKNILMVLAQYCFMVSSNASGQKFYSELAFQLYNIAYTSLPIIVLGVFDYDVPWRVARHFPQLYLVGPRMELFNNVTFVKWVASAVYEAFVIFLFVVYAFNDERANAGSGFLVQYGLLAFTCVVLVANLKLTLLQMSWSVYGGVLWFLGVLAYLPVSIAVSSAFVALSPLDFGSFTNTLGHETYWFVVPLCCVVCLLRHFAWTALQRRFYPLPWQIVQEYYVLSDGKFESTAVPLSTSSHIDVEAGIPMVNGMQQGDHAANYVTAASPIGAQHEPERTASQHQKRKERISSSSGFAYSYDPQTAMAESYISTHSMASVSSALSDAEHRGRTSREDSRSSDFSDAPPASAPAPMSASVTDGTGSSRTTAGLFV